MIVSFPEGEVTYPFPACLVDTFIIEDEEMQKKYTQEGDNASLKASMVYLSILQESQELVSIWRHLLRASRFFQGDYVPQEVSMIALTEER